MFYSFGENNEKIGHLAIGLNLMNGQGDYVTNENNIKYYYCETTSENFHVVELPDNPPQIKEGPTEIKHL